MGLGLRYDTFGPTRRPLHVLLAEDQPELRELLTLGIEADGAHVQAARDGLEALALLSNEVLPDVLVTDVRMPGLSGIDVLRELRRRGSTVPVVLITGFGASIDAAEITRLGAAVMLEKPFDLDDLRTALHNLHAIARLQRR